MLFTTMTAATTKQKSNLSRPSEMLTLTTKESKLNISQRKTPTYSVLQQRKLSVDPKIRPSSTYGQTPIVGTLNELFSSNDSRNGDNGLKS